MFLFSPSNSRSLLALLAAAWAAVALPAAGKPNLITIVTDDQGAWAVGAYGNQEIHTPNMDRLAREGLLFTQAFANTPVCSPTRATYLTGLYPTEHRIADYIAPIESEVGLQSPTWPSVLQRQGYRTGLVGKWHLGDKPSFHPTRHGFNYFMGFLGGGNLPVNPTLEVAGKEQKLAGPLVDLLTDAAIAFVKENRARPFSLSLHFREPHLPYGPVPAEDSAHYTALDPTVPEAPALDQAAVKKSTKAYYASVSSVDRNLGRLLLVIEELGLTENTLVIFTSDHGYNEGRHGVNTKGNGRWIAGGVVGPTRPNMWDTSLRIPLIMRWPAVIKPGRTTDSPFSNIDMFRTVLGAFAIPPPTGTLARGVDRSGLLRGELVRPDPIFGQYDLHNGGLAYMRMIRTERYKLIRFFHANAMDELYDLKSDPDEETNLLRGQGRRGGAAEKELSAALDAWMKSINDPLLRDPY